MSPFENIDLLVLGLTVSGIGILGFTVYFNNRHSVTNKTFLAFTLVSIAWGIANFASYQVSSPVWSLWLWRIVIFLAVWFCFGIFHLATVFPKQEIALSSTYRFALFPVVALVSMLTLTPFVFVRLTSLPAPGIVPVIENGPLIALFGVTVALLVLGAVYRFIKKMRTATGVARQQYLLIMLGTFVTFALLIAFNYVLPTNFRIFTFIPFGAVFIFPFIAANAYAIYEYRLFNVKVIATQILAFFLSNAALFQVFLSSGLLEILFRIGMFALTLVFSIFLIKSVMCEVELREEVEQLATNLSAANDKLKELDTLKSQFLSIASHDLRAPLTVIRNFMSLLLDGTYGTLPPAGQEGLQQVFDRATDMAQSVETYLNVSRIEQGRMKYDFIEVELLPLVKNAVAAFKTNAEKKDLAFSFTASPGLEGKKAKLDVVKINEVLNNLFDNSIKYTPKGSIAVLLEKKGNAARLSVKDTGVGMSKETIGKLFQLFSTGDNSRKINVTSTGVGLYITKAHVEAHGGKVWAESEGEGKGSSFILELPLLS